MNVYSIHEHKPVFLSVYGVALLQSIIIKLTSGRMTINSSFNESICVTGPVFIFLAKEQTINVTVEKTDASICYSVIEVDALSIKKACDNFLSNGADNPHCFKNSASKCLLAPVNAGVSKVFDLLQASNEMQSLSAEKRGYLLQLLLSEFIDNQNALPLFRLLSLKSLREDIYYMITNDLSQRWSLKKIASKLYMSPSTLKRKLMQENTSFSEIYLNARMNKAVKLLRHHEFNVTQVAYMCGYDSVSYFTTVFKKHFKIKPSTFLAFGKNKNKSSRYPS